MSRSNPASAVFCLDQKSGSELWRVPTNLPVWGSPVVDSDQVIVGLGNGQLLQSAEPPARPAGAVVCLDATTHELLWRRETGDAVFTRAAVDAQRVYASARDGFCFCLDRHDGRILWKINLGSPVVTRPALLDGRVYIVASGGMVHCREAQSGAECWTFDVTARTRTQPQMVSSPAVIHDLAGGGRWIYFGAELRGAVQSAAVLYCLHD
jgi:outer membrane protein assembly factor BamB